MRNHILTRVFQSLTGVLLGLAAAFWILRSTGPEPGTELGGDTTDYFLPDPLPAPPFNLLSHQGEVVDQSSFGGKVLAVFFGYTSCPDVCPLTLTHLSQAFADMGETGDRIQVLLITVDPERDTLERLRQYLGAFHPSFLGLTGTEDAIREVADGFGVFFARSGEGPDYTVDHTARTFVLLPSGEIRLTFPVTATPQEMARDLSRVLEDLQ